MKRMFSGYFKQFIFLVVISFVLTNCEKDTIDVMLEETNSGLTIKTISLTEIESNSKAFNIIKPIIEVKEESNKTSNRDTIYNSEYGFMIDTDRVKYVENGNYNSYNFEIIRNNPVDDNLENLFLTLNSDYEYDTFIIKYNFTSEEFAINDYEELINRGFEITSINFDTTSITGRSEISCESVITHFVCNVGTPHTSDFDNSCVIEAGTEIVCTGGGGPGPGPSTSNPTNGSGNNSGSNGGQGGSAGDNNYTGSTGSNPYVAPAPSRTMSEMLGDFMTLTPEQRLWVGRPENEELSQLLVDYLLQCNVPDYCVQNNALGNLVLNTFMLDLTVEEEYDQLLDELNNLFPYPTYLVTLPDYKAEIQKMINHLRGFGNPEDHIFADYVESLLPDLDTMTIGEVSDLAYLTWQQKQMLTIKYAQGIIVPFVEAAYPFIVFAVVDATLGAAIPLLTRIPLSMVTRGERLYKMVRQVGVLGEVGTGSSIRIVTTTSPYAKAQKLFSTLTKDAVSIVTHPNGTIVADMGAGNFIKFRPITASGSDFVATIDLQFYEIWTTIRSVKFKGI